MTDIVDNKHNCAALSFHKSLIGLMQLNQLEEVSSVLQPSFLSSRVLNIYYTVYHLFCCCILMTPTEFANVKLNSPQERSDKVIISKNNTVESWESRKKAESDWSTLITHSLIKKFCNNLRTCDLTNAPSYLKSLYRLFIDDTLVNQKCINGLYEKLCYYRDYVLYRPAFILSESDHYWQTAFRLTDDFSSLPTSLELYNAISEIYNGFLIEMENESKPINDSASFWYFTPFLHAIWGCSVNCPVSKLDSTGHTIEELKKFEFLPNDDPNTIQLPTYISHLLDLENIDCILQYNEKYWVPLKNRFQETISKITV